MKRARETKSLRLQVRATPTERRVLRELARLEGTNESAVLHGLIRAAAEQRGLLSVQDNGGDGDG